MATIGARFGEPSKKAAEAAETVTMRSACDVALLSDLAVGTSEPLSRVLRWMIKWTRGNVAAQKLQDVKIAPNIDLNTDFARTPLSTDQLVKPFGVVQPGGMSPDSWFWNLQRREAR